MTFRDYLLDVDPELFRRQRLALDQLLRRESHGLRFDLLMGLRDLVDEVADQLALSGESLDRAPQRWFQIVNISIAHLHVCAQGRKNDLH